MDNRNALKVYIIVWRLGYRGTSYTRRNVKSAGGAIEMSKESAYIHS